MVQHSIFQYKIAYLHRNKYWGHVLPKQWTIVSSEPSLQSRMPLQTSEPLICLPLSHCQTGGGKKQLFCDLHVFESQHESSHSAGKPQSHSSSSSIKPFPQVGDWNVLYGRFFKHQVLLAVKFLNWLIWLLFQSEGLSLPVNPIPKLDARLAHKMFAILLTVAKSPLKRAIPENLSFCSHVIL